jgi:tetrahydromethanopterin S-methyltransferase subunit B
MKLAQEKIKKWVLLLLTMVAVFGAAVSTISTPAQAMSQKGYINSSGVYGYTGYYIFHGGGQDIEHAVEYGWHVTVDDSYYNYGITWYQCYDSDDGDYYGWIDSKYVTFYSAETTASSVTLTSISDRKGQVNTHGGGVDGYTTSYVRGGSKVVEHSVENAWHITAKTTCYSRGITWYECWDSDDGDYYGWIDSTYLDFYDTVPATAAPVVTSVVVKTVTQEAETVIVEKTVVVTELVTEAPTETTTAVNITTNDPLAAAGTDDNDHDISGLLILVLIGVVILLIIIVAVALILMQTRKRKTVSPQQSFVQQPQQQPQGYRAPQPTAVPYPQSNGNNVQQQTTAATCPCCGALRSSPTDVFCEECGYRFQ